jgi:hypothetical protein
MFLSVEHEPSPAASPSVGVRCAKPHHLTNQPLTDAES